MERGPSYFLCFSTFELFDLTGIIVSYEAIRRWCLKFGPGYARKLKRREGRLGDHWHLDEVFIRINGQQHYLWRAVDQDGDVIDILVQPRRDQGAAERFFRRLLRGQGKRTISDCYRQTTKLLGRPAKDSGRSRPRHRTIRQQPRRSLASAYPPKRTAHAPIQICWSSATVPLASRRRPESLPTRTALAESDESSTSAFAILRHLADCDSGLKSLHDNQPRRTKMTIPAQVDNAYSAVRKRFLNNSRW